MRLRTIGAEAAARAASSAATNWARRRVSMPFHSFVSRPIVFFEAAPASGRARLAASVPCPERVFSPFPADAARAARLSRSAARLSVVAARARGRREAFFRLAGDLRTEALRFAVARRRAVAAAGEGCCVEVSLSVTVSPPESVESKMQAYFNRAEERKGSDGADGHCSGSSAGYPRKPAAAHPGTGHAFGTVIALCRRVWVSIVRNS